MILLRFLLLAACPAVLAAGAADFPGQYNVVWESPSKFRSGQMPLGNGDIAAGVCAIEDGDLCLLLSKNDAYTYNGDIFKTGRVRVSLSPNPFTKGRPFRQTLDLATGSILIEADGVTIRVWADARRPVYHVQVESPEKISVTTAPEFWKRFDDCLFNLSRAPIPEPTQDLRLDRNGRILWYYAVGDRSVFNGEMNYCDVGHLAGKHPDPHPHNTFGNLLECPRLELKNGALTGSGKSFDIRIHALTMQVPDIETWIDNIEALAARPADTAQDWNKHCEWWSKFWDRSHIIAIQIHGGMQALIAYKDVTIEKMPALK